MYGLFMFPFFLLLLVITAVSGILALLGHGRTAGKLLMGIWGGFFSICILGGLAIAWDVYRDVGKSDVYGQYVIDRFKFPGGQANWQYNHYRFELTKDNKILFHITDKTRIIRTDTGSFSFAESYHHPRLKIVMPQPAHHILYSNPTLYVNKPSFHYVFGSRYYGNMFFVKDDWEPREE
ncbi:hypothetical protein [Mucilaginibacter myungsuensis]|uniref:Uncharacterized protein n=1 Tax=Mucilaginibacter myungsuensis TaxID=649104 RepID=A0A929KZ52_9SPHI|nr:hypothetical protein [Mucilaginibacter myungsuensis]MBE9661544.1 hypothetical protein [Mucilaginibacter myungsuensis]MDN3597687.1 hypothetical protein [Mucilaginibacter myungsuensis]